MTEAEILAKALRAGRDYERAMQDGELSKAVEIDKELARLYTLPEAQELWLTPLVVRGRNVIRRNRGLEPINV